MYNREPGCQVEVDTPRAVRGTLRSMSFSMTPGDIPILVGACIALLLSVTFAARATAGTKANFWGAAFLFVSAVRIFLKYLNHSGMIIDYPHFSRLQYPLGLCTPVLIYLYVRFLLNGAQRPTWKTWLHFIPALGVTLYLSPYYLISATEKWAALTSLSAMPQSLSIWYLWGGLLYSVFYLGLTEATRREFVQRHASKKLSGSGQAVVSWVRLVVIGSGVFLVTAVAMRLAGTVVDLNYFLFQIFSILMILACVKLLLLPVPIFAGSDATSKYAKSSLTAEERKKHAAQLTQILEEKELYRRADLRPSAVAAEMGIPEYVLSQVMNEEFGQTFNDLIREHRVRAVRVHLLDPAYSRYTMEAIGREVGFRARASFYRASKEITGQTPTEYRQAHLSESE